MQNLAEDGQNKFDINKVESNDPTVLTEIYNEKVNIAIWKRELTNNLTNSSQQLIDIADKISGTISLTVKPENACEVLSERLPEFALQNYLIEDISNLIDMFCCLFDLKQAGMRLAVLDRAMCPRFHIDRVPCRLVTTYSGIATEWLSNNDVNRSLLGIEDFPVYDKYTMSIEKLNAGDVGLLKGESWIGNEGFGLLHRSPYVEANQSRLLLTLDFA